ncbi:sensor histidine kinase [Tenacibaculum amylolyticum]|uniref:sensor histidine kinase n=1 Tax=Tenacibaculum amylolyticum TaxID=104269 RepID=UPI003894FEA9
MKPLFNRINYKELAYQVVFLTILFFLSSFNKHTPEIKLHSVVFFLTYALLSFSVSYYLTPKFLYTKKYKEFVIGLIVVFLLMYLLEELVLEKIFFDNHRAEHVSNIFYTLLDIGPLLIIMVSFKLAWDSIKKQRELDNLQSTVKESELQFLKSQINPHFLFNNLNNLYSYAIENSPKTPSIILELSSVLRYMLYDCKEDFVPVSKEVSHLKDFTALNELQIENRGEVELITNIAANDYSIAPLILIMFVENAFKHSTASQSENIRIRILLDVSSKGVLHFVCENSFLPNGNNQSLSAGIGLQNVKKRLDLLYPNKYTLKIEEEEPTYKVDLTIKLHALK